ncbi:MAG: 50S ribosomal protein L6 [Cyclobacteriaceae bacterium]|nr:50S ribosomal protein L6 [Cyclobacteriaceae bacterium]
MSRVGNKPITIPKDVEIKIEKNTISVKGPKGELSQQFDPDITIEMNDGELQVSRPTEQKRHKAMHGLYRALVNNMVEGVSNGFTRKLELIGVGYRVEVINNDILDLTLGFSHHVYFKVPPEIKVQAVTEKGKNPTITLQSHDKQLIGQVASKIKSLRKAEPYKGKGIRYVGEYIRRKAGKTAAK